MDPKVFYANDKLTNSIKPHGVKITVTLSESQLHVLKYQAKWEHRTFDQMLQVILYEGWSFYMEDHYINVPRMEPNENDLSHRTYSDGETRDLMIPMIPSFDTAIEYVNPET